MTAPRGEQTDVHSRLRVKPKSNFFRVTSHLYPVVSPLVIVTTDIETETPDITSAIASRPTSDIYDSFGCQSHRQAKIFAFA